MISVILVTYNSVNVLPRCMESLRCCSNSQNLEIVFVDNNSSDETWGWIEQYAQASKGAFFDVKRLHLRENKGYAFANNRGVDISTGDIILLLNPDTVVGYSTIKTCEARLKEQKL